MYMYHDYRVSVEHRHWHGKYFIQSDFESRPIPTLPWKKRIFVLHATAAAVKISFDYHTPTPKFMIKRSRIRWKTYLLPQNTSCFSSKSDIGYISMYKNKLMKYTLLRQLASYKCVSINQLENDAPGNNDK